MAKPVLLQADDLTISKPHAPGAARQRGEVPSSELVPMQFRMPPAFVKAFKQEALDRDMKLNELLKHIFAHFRQTAK